MENKTDIDLMNSENLWKKRTDILASNFDIKTFGAMLDWQVLNNYTNVGVLTKVGVASFLGTLGILVGSVATLRTFVPLFQDSSVANNILSFSSMVAYLMFPTVVKHSVETYRQMKNGEDSLVMKISYKEVGEVKMSSIKCNFEEVKKNDLKEKFCLFGALLKVNQRVRFDSIRATVRLIGGTAFGILLKEGARFLKSEKKLGWVEKKRNSIKINSYITVLYEKRVNDVLVITDNPRDKEKIVYSKLIALLGAQLLQQIYIDVHNEKFGKTMGKVEEEKEGGVQKTNSNIKKLVKENVGEKLLKKIENPIALHKYFEQQYAKGVHRLDGVNTSDLILLLNSGALNPFYKPFDGAPSLGELFYKLATKSINSQQFIEGVVNKDVPVELEEQDDLKAGLNRLYSILEAREIDSSLVESTYKLKNNLPKSNEKNEKKIDIKNTALRL